MKTRQQAAEDTVSELKARYLHDQIQDIEDFGVECFLAGWEAAEQNRWIPVSERLPDERFMPVLIFDANKPHYMQHVQQASWFQQTGSFKIEATGMHTNDVTHWMPLPSPPKPQEL